MVQRGPFPNQVPVQMPHQNIPNNRQGLFQNNRTPQQAQMQQRFPQQPNMNGQEKKGLLSKILGKKQQRNAPQQSPFSLPANSSRNAAATAAAASAASSGGLLQSIMNPENLTSMLDNTQRVLSAAESFGPLVQQYGPLVKNIPSMWKLYQGLKDSDSTDSDEQIESKKEATSQQETNTNSTHSEVALESKQKANHIKPRIKDTKKQHIDTLLFRRQGESKPKLFI